MPLPTLEKTWTFSVNQAIPTSATFEEMNRRAAVAIISTIVGFGWTVVGSSNSTTAAMDGVNRIGTTYTNWVSSFSTAVRSWIVLSHAGFGQILFYGASSTSSQPGENWAVYFSPAAGFTGGTTSTRPTATDEVNAMPNAPTSQSVVGASLMPINLHAMMSSDGSQLRVFITGQGAVESLLMAGLVPDGPSGFVGKACGFGSSGAVGGSTVWGNSTSGPFRTIHAGAALVLGLYSLSLPTNAYTYPNVVDGSWPLMNIVCASGVLGQQGVYGRLVDAWYGPTRQVGATFPDDNTHQFVNLGEIVLPWNGSIPNFYP